MVKYYIQNIMKISHRNVIQNQVSERVAPTLLKRT